MKRKRKITMVVLLTALILSAIIITNVEAGNTVRVAVSCTIPSILEMNVKPENIESREAEIENTSGRICVQQEDESFQLVSESQSEGSIELYSFYER